LSSCSFLAFFTKSAMATAPSSPRLHWGMIGQAFEHHAKQLGVAGVEKTPGMAYLKDLQY